MPVSRGRDCLQLLIPLCFTFSAAQKYRKSLEELKALAETKCLLNAEGKMYSPCMLSPPACEEVGAAVTSGNGILEKGPVFVPAFIGCWVRDHLWKLKILHLSFKSGWAAPFWGVGVGKRSIEGRKVIQVWVLQIALWIWSKIKVLSLICELRIIIPAT